MAIFGSYYVVYSILALTAVRFIPVKISFSDDNGLVHGLESVLVRPWLSSACGRSERHAASEGDGDLVSLHIRCVIDELDEKLCS